MPDTLRMLSGIYNNYHLSIPTLFAFDGMDKAGTAAEGVTQEVTLLYREHHRWLGGWLRGKVGNGADADDLMQDTFIKVLRAHAQAQGQLQLRTPRAYLATIASRLVINFHRRRSLEQAYLEVLASMPESQVPSLETQAMMMEALLEIDQMLDGLGAKVKQAFLLAQCEELSYHQIAARLGISERTVRNYLAKAMAHCCLMLP